MANIKHEIVNWCFIVAMLTATTVPLFYLKPDYYRSECNIQNITISNNFIAEIISCSQLSYNCSVFGPGFDTRHLH